MLSSARDNRLDDYYSHPAPAGLRDGVGAVCSRRGSRQGQHWPISGTTVCKVTIHGDFVNGYMGVVIGGRLAKEKIGLPAPKESWYILHKIAPR